MFNQPSYPHPYTFPQSSPYGQMGQQQSGPSNPGHFPGVDMSTMGMPFNRNAMASPTSYGGNYSAGGLGGAPGHMQQDPMAAWGYGNQSNQGCVTCVRTTSSGKRSDLSVSILHFLCAPSFHLHRHIRSQRRYTLQPHFLQTSRMRASSNSSSPLVHVLYELTACLLATVTPNHTNQSLTSYHNLTVQCTTPTCP
jgi:hypothetical protein